MLEKKKNKTNDAIIHFGAVTIRMLIFRLNKQGKIFQVNRSERMTNLGQDVMDTGLICEDAIARNLEAADEFMKIARDYDVKHIYAFGTSALRNAANAEAFIEILKDRTGIELHVITGREEALYGFLGVSQCYDGEVMVVNISDTTTRILFGKREIDHMACLNQGAEEATEAFFTKLTPDQEEIDALYHHALEAYTEKIESFHIPEDHPYRLVGNGSFICILALVEKKEDIFDQGNIHNSVVTREGLHGILKELLGKNLHARRQIPGLQERRAKDIIAAAVLACALLDAAGRDELTVCGFDNLEGAAFVNFLSPEEQRKQIVQIG